MTVPGWMRTTLAAGGTGPAAAYLLGALAGAAAGCHVTGDGGGGREVTFVEEQRIGPADSIALTAVSPSVSAFDHDGDGDLDLVTVGGVAAAGTWNGGVALLQNDGTGAFEDVARAAGLEARGNLSGAHPFDYDNDGDADLLLLAMQSAYDGGPSADASHYLYRNDGDGTFTDVTAAAGIDVTRGSTSAAIADIDGDGYLDVYLCQNIDYDLLPALVFAPNNTDPSSFGHPDLLFRNNGDGTFSEESVARGLGAGNATIIEQTGRPADDVSLDALFVDHDGDGDQDLLVGNQLGYQLLYRNDGAGNFSDVSLAAGIRGMGWGGWFGYAPIDVDADGQLEIVAANFGASWLAHPKGGLAIETDDIHPYPVVLRWEDGAFRDVAADVAASNLLSFPNQRSDLPAPAADSLQALGLGWAVSGFDYDNDGLTDLYQTGSLVTGPGTGILFSLDQGAHPGQLLRQTAPGEFTDVTQAARIALVDGAQFQPQWGHTVGDFNGDGFIDIASVVWTLMPGSLPGRLRVFLSSGNGNHWLGLRLEGTTSNRDGIGAIIRLYQEEDSTPQVRGVFAHGWTTPRDAVRFGLGEAESVARIEIRWPSGTEQVLTDVAADQVLDVIEP